jgi:hypothetical protein
VNTFGYIGWAKGDLPIGARTPDGALAVSGTLKVRYEFIDGPEADADVQVDGTIDAGGQYVSAKVSSGTKDLESVYLVLAKGSPFSALHSPGGGPAYQTECSASTAVIPHGSDLRTSGALRFLERSDGSLDVHVDVVNVGDRATGGATGRVKIAGLTATAALHSASAAAGAPAANLGAGEAGYLEAVLPKGALARCAEPQVTLDVDRTMQAGAPDPFANDTAKVSTPCVTWSRKIDANALGSDPDAFLVGKTLGGIVASAEVGRKDGKLCSSCHYQGSGNTYSPSVQAGASATIAPTDTIGGTTWAAPGGLASRFLSNPVNKPDYLKAIVKQWLDDGAWP